MKSIWDDSLSTKAVPRDAPGNAEDLKIVFGGENCSMYSLWLKSDIPK